MAKHAATLIRILFIVFAVCANADPYGRGKKSSSGGSTGSSVSPVRVRGRGPFPSSSPMPVDTGVMGSDTGAVGGDTGATDVGAGGPPDVALPPSAAATGDGVAGDGVDAGDVAVGDGGASDSGAPPASQTVVVGGSAGWIIQDYADLQLNVGDSLVFNYQGGAHTVWELPNKACEFSNGQELSGLGNPGTPVSFTVQLTSPGTRVFACDVPGHCPMGMLFQVVVT